PAREDRRSAGSGKPRLDIGATRRRSTDVTCRRLDQRAQAVGGSDETGPGQRSFPTLDAGRDRPPGRRLARVPDSGVSAGGRSAVVSLPATAATGARTGPAWRIRRFEPARPGPGLLQP